MSKKEVRGVTEWQYAVQYSFSDMASLPNKKSAYFGTSAKLALPLPPVGTLGHAIIRTFWFFSDPPPPLGVIRT